MVALDRMLNRPDLESHLALLAGAESVLEARRRLAELEAEARRLEEQQATGDESDEPNGLA